MKVIALKRAPGAPLVNPPAVEVIVDSATVAAGRPLFLPDFDSRWRMEVCLAFKISRLGKDISAKFASRYYDSFTVAVRFVPIDIKNKLVENNMPEGVLGLFDYCLGFGEWHSLPPEGHTLEIEVGGRAISVSAKELDTDNVIECISHYTTLKTGDVILPCALTDIEPIEPGTDFYVKIRGISTFDFKIR